MKSASRSEGREGRNSVDIREGHSRKQEQPMQRPQGKPCSFPGTSSSLLLLNNRCLCILLEEQKGLRSLFIIGLLAQSVFPRVPQRADQPGGTGRNLDQKGNWASPPLYPQSNPAVTWRLEWLCPCSVRLRCHWHREALASELSSCGARPASG